MACVNIYSDLSLNTIFLVLTKALSMEIIELLHAALLKRITESTDIDRPSQLQFFDRLLWIYWLQTNKWAKDIPMVAKITLYSRVNYPYTNKFKKNKYNFLYDTKTLLRIISSFLIIFCFFNNVLCDFHTSLLSYMLVHTCQKMCVRRIPDTVQKEMLGEISKRHEDQLTPSILQSSVSASISNGNCTLADF